MIDGWEKANQFLSGFGDVFLEVFITLVIYGLFIFMVPESYRQLLKWTTALSAVSYVAQWLTTK